MIIKTRSESAELMLLRSLSIRMSLSEKERSNFLNLEKGFKGEQQFDKWFETNFSNEGLILNDLLLESNNTIFQIDSLLITSDVVYLLEIKNYEGDFYRDGDRWCTLSGNEIKNPLLQLKRSESLFRRLLQDFGYKISVEANLIFINPEFFLYQAPLNPSIIFPSQLNRFMDKLNKKSTNLKDRHQKLAKHLVSIKLKDSPYTRLPDYCYDQLEKGISCGGCNTLMDDIDAKEEILECKKCGNKEDVPAAILRSVREFSMLFPDKKITTNTIYEWCKGIRTKRTLQRILSQNLNLIGFGRPSFYIFFQAKPD
ncbi:nuclease-related domain-containing protein [Cytobacillus dafuensis]|uniref:NERD domain-containing protein n=1 Tax=Cytobacillus dafuensis TaxID=1742359 RepID=A0A5B8ZDF2_CYTDA|nr:nuclease-related domain-containing protein [Cytobacillus dafuensis]QED49849.1 NERD domain-containing protein [Cytobacillus dafuensis]